MERFDIVRKQVVGSVEFGRFAKGRHPVEEAFRLIGKALKDSPAYMSPDATDTVEFEFEGRTYMAVIGADETPREPETPEDIADVWNDK